MRWSDLDSGACPGPDPGFAGMTTWLKLALMGLTPPLRKNLIR